MAAKNYDEIRQLIIDTLAGRPTGTMIYPEGHQEIDLQLLDFAKAISETISTGLSGEAQADTQPIQPANANVAYVFQVAPNTTKTFSYFRDSEGTAISVTTNSTQLAFGFLIWNKSYWTPMTVMLSVSTPAFDDLGNNIIQLLDGTTPVYPRTKAEAVFFDGDTDKTLDEELSRLGQKVVEKNPGINLFNPNDPDVLIGKFINYDGSIGSGSYNASGFIPVEEGTTYYIARESENGYRFVTPYDASKTIISVTSTGFERVRSFTTPAGCKFVRVTFNTSDYDVAQVSSQDALFVPYNPIKGYLTEEDANIADIKEEIHPETKALISGEYIDVTADVGETLDLTPQSSSAMSYGIYPVTPGDIFFFEKASGSTGKELYTFIDSNNVILSKGIIQQVQDAIIPVPDDANRIVINNTTDYEPDYHILQYFANTIALSCRESKENDDRFNSALLIGHGILDPLDADNVAGKYINPATGTLSTGSYFTTGYMPVTPGKTYYSYIKTGETASIRNLAYFTSEKEVIYGAGLSNVTSFVPPVGAGYVRVSYDNTYGDFTKVFVADAQAPLSYGAFVLLKEPAVNAPNSPATKKYVDDALPNIADKLLGGKKIYACGDSYTHGDYTDEAEPDLHKFQDGLYAGQNKVWPFYIGRRTGAIVTNLAVNGGRITTTPGWETINPDGCFSYALYQQVPSDADYIIIKYGINDAYGLTHDEISFGTIDSTDINTFYGAWNTVLSWYITNRPKAKIGIIVTNDVSNSDVINAIIAIAKKYGIKYLDEATDENFPYFYRQFLRTGVASSVRSARDDYFKMNANNSHPNDACQEYESTMIEAFIRTL